MIGVAYAQQCGRRFQHVTIRIGLGDQTCHRTHAALHQPHEDGALFATACEEAIAFKLQRGGGAQEHHAAIDEANLDEAVCAGANGFAFLNRIVDGGCSGVAIHVDDHYRPVQPEDLTSRLGRYPRLAHAKRCDHDQPSGDGTSDGSDEHERGIPGCVQGLSAPMLSGST